MALRAELLRHASSAPHTVESLLRVVGEAREGEVAFLNLMIDKLKLQLLRRSRSQFGPSSEQLQDPLIALFEGHPLDEEAAAEAEAPRRCQYAKKSTARCPCAPAA